MLMSMGTSGDGSTRPWRAGEARENKIVFIGRNLDREALNASFRACLIT